MPDLYHSLLGHDLGHLRIVAESWGLELKSNSTDPAAKELSAALLLDPGLVAEIVAALPPEARQALAALVDAGGRIPYAAFTRRFGEVRELGAAKRDRERPYLEPASAAEVLFYRALLARAFFDSEKGPQEFVYLPEDMLLLIQTRRGGWPSAPTTEPPGRAATPGEKTHVIPASDHVLDDATTLLAALRTGRSDVATVAPWLHGDTPRRRWQSDLRLQALLTAAKLVKKNIPQADAVKSFLEASRAEALKTLVEAWRSSETFNELRLMPQLVCEGEWSNQPRPTREFLLALLHAVPEGKWWNLNSLISDVKKKAPDFQRPAGDYDSWFVKRASDGQYLRGFASWDEVDGALIRFFITEILHWLGVVDLASAKPEEEITAFRITGIGYRGSGGGARITNAGSRSPNIENGKLKITSNGRISAPRLVPRAIRYQLARFCEWDEDGGRVAAGSRHVPSGPLDHQRRTETKADEYRYRLTPGSLAKAKGQGLKVEHLLALLARHSDAGVPPSLVKALKRWEANGTEARAETQVVLRVSRPEVLEELRKSKAARFLGEPLGPTAVVIKAGAQSKVIAALAEMGLLAEDETAEAAVPGGDIEPAPRTA